ncbi:MAG: acetyl-CoA carboxylase biotin carboxyl carrier protein subunit [Clostridia bacterium]|nr:acetyl-CoA carboxylase biotin carboxyl carrier protein subunit [Clostridia bacterium]
MKKYNITVNGTTYEVIVEEVGAHATSPAAPVYSAPATAAAPAAKPVKTMAGGANKVSAPMPGTILDVKVSLGQKVSKGDVVCVLEAMKMENDIPAPCDGVVASINVQKGSTVAANDILISIN